MQWTMKKTIIITGLLSMLSFSITSGQSDKDPFQWLESVDSEEAIDWVKSHNQPTLDYLRGQPGFEERQQQALEIMTAADRIVYGSIRDGWVYNFWQTEKGPQGIWRRTSYENYQKGDYEWQIILDLDQLSAQEGVNWVWKGASFMEPGSNLCLIQLSDGGKDAVQIREFDIETQTFLGEGFFIPEAKTNFIWADENAVWLATRFDDNSVTESGYPRVLKLLKRGQEISEATLIYETDVSHMSIELARIYDGEDVYPIMIDQDTFFTSDSYLINNSGEETKLVHLPIQQTDKLETIYQGQCILQTRKPWTVGTTTYPAGALLSFDLSHFLSTGELGEIQTLFIPSDTVAIKEVSRSNSSLIVNYNDNVTNRIETFEYTNGEWKSDKIDLPANGSVDLVFASSKTHIVYLGYENFLTPDSLIELDSRNGKWQIIQSLPSRFDSSNLVAEQKFATSKDGTRIPYFLVHQKDLILDGNNATFLYGYGGFEISLNPFYLSTYGKLWVEPGNVFVLANIRGGGEFGPAWHQAALKHNRQRAYDDFHAIAEDLIAQKITSPKHLGIGGGSNGGLLVGVAFTQRPDLYNAVFCSVPLLDMLRYHELPPGASWIAEYGDPRIPEDHDYIATYSPYQNLHKDKSYPKVFFYTSTRDDRVHPGHARKMAAKMEQMGHPLFYFERIEGGHAGGANLTQYAELYALEFTYLDLLLSAKE